ncbi:MAG: daunorubicin/doxorubicin resistance ABC transporter ATP-binding protein DrrA, partial [Actinomycetota bacterium]|nr:daunorubicin/doxorubicin resistance ABC transporter ATP-binding protein DrrA [Actinomycetota bacterium]
PGGVGVAGGGAAPPDRARVHSLLAVVASGAVGVGENGRELTAAVDGGVGALRRVLEGLERESVAVLDIGLRRPTLDDVFLSLTGHATESDDPTTDSTETAEVTR